MTASPLGSFEGKDIIQTSIKVTNAGDGLSAALSVDPQIIHQGDEVYVVLRCTARQVQFDPIKDTDCLARVTVLRAGDAALVDGELVREVLDRTAEKVRRKKEAESGQASMGDGLLRLEHEEGAHAEGLVEFCPLCDEERDAEAGEADELAERRGRGAK